MNRLVAFAFLVLSLWMPAKVAAVPLSPGDILVADPADGFLSLAGGGRVIRVDPVTGIQSIFASDDQSFRPVGLAVAANGDILILNKGSGTPGGGRGVKRADPGTGALTTVSLFGAASLAIPTGIAVEANGDILVTTFDPFFGGLPNVIRVDPTTGVLTTLSSGGSFVVPDDVAVAANGDILVVDRQAFGGSGGIIRVNPVTGAQTTVSFGGNFVDPTSLDIAANGDILVANFNAGSNTAVDVIRVDPATGLQTIVSSVGGIVQAHGIALAGDGEIWIAGSMVGGPGVARVDPVTGVQTVFSNNAFFRNPNGIIIVPDAAPVPEPSALLLLGSGLAGLVAMRVVRSRRSLRSR